MRTQSLLHGSPPVLQARTCICYVALLLVLYHCSYTGLCLAVMPPEVAWGRTLPMLKNGCHASPAQRLQPALPSSVHVSLTSVTTSTAHHAEHWQ